jgi:membrane associated rhomboid family serine protease
MIVAVCVVVFAVQMVSATIAGTGIVSSPFSMTFELIPALAFTGAFWQFFTYMFLHADMMHLFINMFIFFMFGMLIERAMGWKWFLTIFIVSGLGSAFLHLLLNSSSLLTPMLGASGAIFGILTAFAFMFPDMKLYVFPIPVPIKAFYAIIGIALFELLLGLFNIMPGFAHFGHLGGIVTGFIIMMYWRHTQKRRVKTVAQAREYEFYWE